MKRLLSIFIALMPLVSMGQSTVSPDTVCYGSNGSLYSVTSDPNVTYTWTVASPGVITSGQGTGNIGVNWASASPGLIPNAVTVTVTNQFGCDTLVRLDVFILQIVPTFTTSASCVDGGCIPLTGTPSGGVFTGVGVSGSYQFCPSVAGVGSHTLTYAYTFAGCTFTTTGSGPFVVNPLPSISPISHN
jgi:hypothetical protein